MKQVKKMMAGILVLSVLLSCVPMPSVSASSESSQSIEQTNITAPQARVSSDDAIVTSLVCQPVEIMVGTNGYFTPGYDMTTNQKLGDFYFYNPSPRFTVTFADGQTYENQSGGVYHNGRYYSLTVSGNQHYNNQWGIGIHTANAELNGFSTTFQVTITESIVESIELQDVVLLEQTDGYMRGEYDYQSGQYIDYYHYNVNPRFKVTFKDGTVQENCMQWVYYNNQSFQLEMCTNQGANNQWGIGEYTVSGYLAGVSDECKVTIEGSPVASIQVDDYDIIQGTKGYQSSQYDSSTGEYIKYYRYYTSVQSATVTLKDGSTVKCGGQFSYKGTWYQIEISDNQSASNAWGLGSHPVTATLLGATTTFNINIIKTPYVKIDVLDMKPVYANEPHGINGGVAEYPVPAFTFKVTKDDGTSEIMYFEGTIWSEQTFSQGDFEMRVSSNQDTTPWTSEGDNYFTITHADLSVKVKVNMQQTQPYDYDEYEGKLYITSCNELIERIEIPSEIDGKPVAGLLDLGNAQTTVRELVLPDTVEIIGESALGNWGSNLETIVIGSGVSYLSLDMFDVCHSLQNIIVAEDNPYYKSVDGILYDRAGTTIVVYPLGKGEEFEVPATVTNADVLFSPTYIDYTITFADGSKAFVEEDGVIYNSDKTKVLSCNTDKAGAYIMPDTVTEIADYAFEGCTELTSVDISSNVTSIAYGAFANCTSLKSVNLPEGLETIEASAFDYCSLNTLELPSTLHTIGANAFTCNQLTELVIPDNVMELGKGAFRWNEHLTTVVVGSGISVIPASAFEWCDYLTKVTLKNAAVQIGASAFYECSLLKDMNFENVTGEIGVSAFTSTGFESVALSEGVTSMVYGFDYTKSLTTIDVPNSLLRIDAGSFVGTAWFTEQPNGPVYLEHILYQYKGDIPEYMDFVVEDGTTVLADGLFLWCDTLQSIELPEGLITIGVETFRFCESLKELNIPASLQYIGERALDGCKNLEAINVDEENEHFTSVNGVLYNKDCTELLWCPKQETDTFVVPSSVQQIASRAFSCSGVKNLVLNGRDTTWADGAIGFACTAPWEDEWANMTVYCYEDSPAYACAKANLLNVEIIEATVAQVAIETVPTKVTYERGEELNTQGLTLKVTYDDGTTAVIDSGFECTGFDSTTAGEKTVKVLYKGISADFKVTVKEPTVKNIAVQSAPTKTVYTVGEKLDTTGLTILATYSDGTTSEITSGYDVEVCDMSTSGVKNITVTYDTYTTTFAIDVYQTGTVLVGSARGEAGDVVEVHLSFVEAMNIKTIAIRDLSYDTSKLQLISGTWNLKGAISDWNMDDVKGVHTFTQNTSVKDNFFTFTFRILEEATVGDIPISCSVDATEKFADEREPKMTVTCVAGNVTVFEVLRGDVDGNGYVTTDDAIYLLYHTNNSSNYPVNQDVDFDGNGTVTSDDAIYLLYHVMLPNSYPLNK